MNETILPTSPNWYLSSIVACANDGTTAWGGRHSITIVKRNDELNNMNYSFIDKAHHERVTSIAFSPVKEDGTYHLVSGGDDNVVKIWNLNDFSVKLNNSELNSTQKVIGVDWSKSNPNLICFVSDDGLMIIWDIKFNISKKYDPGKMVPTCIACCPHDEKIVAIGSKIGLIYIIDVNRLSTIYKLRGHDEEIVSLSWCPSPFNIYEPHRTKDFLLASGAKDQFIYLWRAVSDGRYQIQIKLPNIPLMNKGHRIKAKASAGNYTKVNWLLPNILLSNTSWGELVMWNLKIKNLIPKLVHGKHLRGLFSIAAIGDITDKIPKDSDNENWRSNVNIKAIWTVAQDRQVICCSVTDGKPTIDCIIPTQGGFVYCIAACPIDTSLVAFGAGDANIRLWYLSEPDNNKLELQFIWDKIKSKARALSWHPLKENLLAYGTEEGRVGIIDTNSQKTVVCRSYFRSIIYSMGWGIDPKSKGSALYVCGDGVLYYYPENEFHENPLPVHSRWNAIKHCTEFSWHSDDTLLAIGFKDGSIDFLKSSKSKQLLEYGRPIHTLKKAINCLAWHPLSTSADSGYSLMANYLAVATNDTAVTIFEIFNKTDEESEESDDLPFYRTVATLNGHTDRVICLAWSPHMSGYLVSGGYDKTLQVWKVETQEIIATYISHFSPVFCCMWSPLSSDLIISGSGDSTLQIWSVSKQKVLNPSLSKISSKGKRTKKKKIKDAECEIELNDGEIKINESEKQLTIVQSNEIKNEISCNSIEKINKKKKTKKTTYFPIHSSVSVNSNLWCSTLHNIINSLKKEDQVKLDIFDYNEIEDIKDEPNELCEKVPYLLGDKTNLENSLESEKKKLFSNGYYDTATEIDLWRDNLEDNLLEAEKNKCLSDFMVSLATSVSIDMWKRLCESYAMQLTSEDPQKAASYFLCIHKLYKAIDVLMASKCYKEAYVLAFTRLEPTDPIIESILSEWAVSCEKVGNFKTAAECYIRLGEYQKAALYLAGRKDLYSLFIAIQLSDIVEDSILFDSASEKALFIALTNSNIRIARSITQKCPKLKCREPEVVMFDEINKSLVENSDEKILKWLKGSSDFSISDKFSENYPRCSEKYLALLQKTEFPFLENEKMVQIKVCHEFVLSFLAVQEKQQFEHIIKASDIILQHEKNSTNLVTKSPGLIKYLSILDGKSWTDPSSLFNKNENESLSKSLNAYLCISVVQWFLKNEIIGDEVVESENFVAMVLEKHLENLLDKEAVDFWTITNRMHDLESKLSLSIGILPGNDNDSIINELETIKDKRFEFIKNRISSPNPLYSYAELIKVIEKTTDEEVRKKITTLVTDSWNKIIS